MNEPLASTCKSQIVYAVFAAVRGGVSYDFLAAYSTREGGAQAFINAQDQQLRECLVIWNIEIDRHPTDPFWTIPQDIARAARFVSSEQISAASGTAPRIDFEQFRTEVDSMLDQGNRDQPAEARDVAAAFHALTGLPEDAIPRDHATRDELNERIDHLARLAAGTDYALVCGACGRAISRLAAYVERSPLSHTHSPGTCGVCGRTGSVSPSEDWIGGGD